MTDLQEPLRGAELLQRLLSDRAQHPSPLTHLELLPERVGTSTGWPQWAPDELVGRLAGLGITAPWAHQARCAELAWGGSSVVVCTETASGKSLGYQLPVLSALSADTRATALYLSPTKALGNDQLRAATALAGDGVRAAMFDGDTPVDERDWVRAHSRWVFTNPDMLHRAILPAHHRWSSFLRRLRFVVIDECHTYRGIFGSHVAHVLRRLQRICARYRSGPVFILASATVRDPAGSASRLTGVAVTAVSVDCSPRPAVAFALWEPPLTDRVGGAGESVRRSAPAETATLLAELVGSGARTLAFVRSRRGAETVALHTRRLLREHGSPQLEPRVAAYRAGYLPEERRAVEAALSSGRLLGVASTNALELGLDIAGLDTVLLAGFPGTMASLWQQAGRAGRRGAPALVVFIARDDPLDTYLVHHPEAVFGSSLEATVTDPANPHVLGPQLCCAAAELPITEADLPVFGGASALSSLDAMVAAGALRRRPQGWYWAGQGRPDVDIRGAGDPQVTLVEGVTGRVLGTVDPGAAHATAHAGAVYLHQGASFIVEELNLDDSVALVRAAEPDWTTMARDITAIDITDVLQTWHGGPVQVCFGAVQVTTQVVAYQRRRLGSGAVIDETALDLPARQLRTRSVWYTVDLGALIAAGIDAGAVPGALHAAEHAAIGLLPLFATCDRWDIGGVSTALHHGTGQPTVFVYDGHPGGAGFAEHGHQRLAEWLAATREAIITCGCAAGSVVRAVPQVRQRQRPVGQGRRCRRAGRRTGRPHLET